MRLPLGGRDGLILVLHLSFSTADITILTKPITEFHDPLLGKIVDAHSDFFVLILRPDMRRVMRQIAMIL